MHKCRPLRTAVVFFALVMIGGCASHKPHSASLPPTEPASLDYVDLLPGWRLEVITPVLKSGGFQLRTTIAAGEQGNMNAVAGPDFIGYESSYYVVRRKGDDEVTIDFRSAQLHKDGNVMRLSQPRVDLFHIPRGSRLVRLMYLLRLSNADHDMAIVSAKTADELQERTNAIRADPVHGCAAPACFWIPAGIAVHRYEPLKDLHG